MSRLQDVPVYFLIWFETSFLTTLDTQIFISKKNLICIKSFTKKQRIINNIEKFLYLQIPGYRHCAPILTSTEIFIKTID